MNGITDNEFLVLRKDAAAKLRKILDDTTMVESKLRSTLLASLTTGHLTNMHYGILGLYKRIRISIGPSRMSAVVTLVWAVNDDGTPLAAPDGIRRLVFFYDIREVQHGV